MPLSSPGGGAAVLGSVDLAGDRRTFNNGAAIDVTFNDAWWNQIIDRGVIGGQTSYIGLISDLTKNKINQTPALPSTVMAAGTIFSPFLDDNDDIYVAGTGGALREMAISQNGGATWVLIANSPLQSQITRGLTVAQGRLFYTANQFGAFGDLAFSDDLGASWTEQFSNLTAGGNRVGLTVNPLQTHLVVLRGQADFAFTTNPLASPPTWTQVNSPGILLSQAAFNRDASVFVAVGLLGEIVFSTNSMATFTVMADAVNPLFDPGAALMTSISIGYSPQHEGFIILTPRRIGAFLPEANPAVPTPIFNIGNVGLSIGRVMADNAGNYMAPNATTQDEFYGNFIPFI